MHCTRKLTDAVTWVGGSDRRLVLFENLFPIPRGVAYNSYLIMDEKTALMDTVDRSISRQFLENVTHELGGPRAGLPCGRPYGAGPLCQYRGTDAAFSKYEAGGK